jgi:hypothetical protein
MTNTLLIKLECVFTVRNNSEHITLLFYETVCDPGISVSIVSGYGLDNRAIEFRSPAEAKESFL